MISAVRQSPAKFGALSIKDAHIIISCRARPLKAYFYFSWSTYNKTDIQIDTEA